MEMEDERGKGEVRKVPVFIEPILGLETFVMREVRDPTLTITPLTFGVKRTRPVMMVYVQDC
jgi:hypothetical protein